MAEEVKDTTVICTKCGRKIYRFYYPINLDIWCHECIESVKKPVHEINVDDLWSYIKNDYKELNDVQKGICSDCEYRDACNKSSKDDPSLSFCSRKEFVMLSERDIEEDGSSYLEAWVPTLGKRDKEFLDSIGTP